MTDTNLDALVARYLELADTIEQLATEQAAIKEQLRGLDVGKHVTSYGIAVTVSAPSRRFNPSAAKELLAPEVLELCKSDGYDAKKLKSFLSPVLLEQCMDAGSGDPVVRIA